MGIYSMIRTLPAVKLPFWRNPLEKGKEKGDQAIVANA